MLGSYHCDRAGRFEDSDPVYIVTGGFFDTGSGRERTGIVTGRFRSFRISGPTGVHLRQGYGGTGRKGGFLALFSLADQFSLYGIGNDLAHGIVEAHFEDVDEEVDGVTLQVVVGPAPVAFLDDQTWVGGQLIARG